MAKKKKRFQIVHSESPAGGLGQQATILLDTETGVLYLSYASGYGGGVTPLVDASGKPLSWTLDQLGEWEEEP